MGRDEEQVLNTETNSSSEITKEKGGFRATSFIYALVTLENIGFVANATSLVLYFSYKIHFDLSSAANTLTNFLGSAYLLTVVGGFLSDTQITRFKTCLIFGTLEVLGLAMMTVQAHTDALLPNPCGKSRCVEKFPAFFFYASLCLLALGVGGVKGSLPPFGADQFDPKDPKEAKSLASFFNWLLLSSVAGATIGVTFVVYVSTNKSNQNWWKGFLIVTAAAFVGFVLFGVGRSFYRIQVPTRDSPFVRVAQVVVVAFKNRRLSTPESAGELYEVNEKDSSSAANTVSHTTQFKFLDKAAILRPNNTNPGPWRACTVTQVEEVKILARMLPIIASTIVINTCLAQLQTFSVQQGYRMDPKLGPSFKVPAASIPVIPLLFMMIFVPIYDKVFVPFARKLTNHPSGITQLQRVGVGLILSTISMSVAAVVEVKRRNRSVKDPLKPISLFWLSFQYGIFGVADMFTLVGSLEFFYREAPDGMKSLSTSFTWISTSFGYFLSSVIVDGINSATKRGGGGKGWLEGQDLDGNRLDLFYWFMAGLSGVNFLSYVYWATWYKYKNYGEKNKKVAGDVVKVVAKEEEEEVTMWSNGGYAVEERIGANKE